MRAGAVFALVLLAGCGAAPAPPAAPPPAGSPLLTIAFVGDTHGAGIDLAADPLAGAGDLLARADVFVFNLEGVLAPDAAGCRPFPNQSVLRGPPGFADYLVRGPASIATLANNHLLDCGDAGLLRTLAELESRGIEAVGAGRDAQEAGAPMQISVNGMDLTVAAFLAMQPDLFAAGPASPGVAPWPGAAAITALAEGSDFLVVALHLHLAPGWTSWPASENIDLVIETLEAGADLVVAHGPHVPHGIVVRDGRVGFLSLGNFLFWADYPMPEVALRCIVAEVGLHADRLRIALHPFRLDAAGRPTPTSAVDARRILDESLRSSSLSGSSIEIRDGSGHLDVLR